LIDSSAIGIRSDTFAAAYRLATKRTEKNESKKTQT